MSLINHTNNRIHAFDSLRSIMMFLGIVLHSTEVYLTSDNQPWPKDPYSTSIFLDYLEYLIHIFRMPIFFIMAGFFGALLFYRRGWISMFKNRFRRILLPFIVFLTILYPITVFSLKYVEKVFLNDVNAFHNTLNIDLLFPLYTIHLWFLYYLFLITVFVVLCAKLLGRGTKFINRLGLFFEFTFSKIYYRIPILGATIFFLLVLIWNLSPPTPLSWAPDIASFIFYLFFYVFGWFLYKSKDNITNFENKSILNVSMGILLFTAGFIFRESLDDISRGVVNAFSMAFLVFGIIGIFSRYYSFESKIIQYVSASSYWSYLIHIPFTILIPGLIFEYEVSALLKSLCNLLITSIICFISYNYLVKSTFLSVFLNGKKYKK